MKELDKYLRATYSESRQTAIMTETLATFPDPDISTTIPYSVIKIPTTDADINYLNNKDINEAICQNLRKEDV